MSNTLKKKKKLSRLTYNLIIILVFLVGLLVLLYPTLSDTYNKLRNQSLIVDYEKAVSDITQQDYSKIMQDAREYNAQHLYNTFTDTFDGEEYILSHPYDTLLNPGGNNIMGYIEIPKISVKLAIGHGTGTYVLERGVGHVEGTSLPIGGKATHSVLAGHRGLPSAKIFTDLDMVDKGDKFFLYILNEILAYEIDQIEIVEPNDDSFLQIEEDQDLVTLLTCTPYGVNSHRMLVRGHRIPYVPEDIAEQKSERQISDREKPIVITVVGLVIVLLLIIGMKIYKTIKNKNKRNNDGKRILADDISKDRKEKNDETL